MALSRRDMARLLAVSVVSGALSSALWVKRQREAASLLSDTITGPWDELTPGAFWLLPDLHEARMVVPDRAHRPFEMLDPARRGLIRRTRSFTVSTNGARLRGPTFSPTPAPGVRRWVAIGDSVTFGWGVAAAQSWPAQLQAELARRGQSIEVLNAGVPAQRLHVMGAWLERMAPQYGVEGVLFTRRLPLDQPEPAREFAAALRRAQRALPQARFLALLPPVARLDPAALGDGHLGELQRLRQELPEVSSYDLTAALRQAQGSQGVGLVRAGTALQLVRLDTGEVLEQGVGQGPDLPESFYTRLDEDDSAREALFFDSGHPDAEGLGVMAQAIAGLVEQAGWLG